MSDSSNTIILIENLQDKINVTCEMENIINRAIELCLKSEGLILPSEISLILVDNEAIRKINNEHRGIDSSTDVLSFPLSDFVEGILEKDVLPEVSGDYDFDMDRILLGDIAISLEKAEMQSGEYGHSFDRELAFLITHGVYHLLGYDHADTESEKIMINKQENILTKMDLHISE